MTGEEPKDVEGECNAHLYIGDNFGDNHATMRCQLRKNHQEFEHREEFERLAGGKCVVTWTIDERNYDGERDRGEGSAVRADSPTGSGEG